MTTYKREAFELSERLRELLSAFGPDVLDVDRNRARRHALDALERWDVDRVNLYGLYGDPFTDQAALLIENERRINERAHELTRTACDRLATSDDENGPPRVTLADQLRALVESFGDLDDILEGPRAWGATGIRLWLDHVDWLQYASILIGEEQLQRSQEVTS